MRTLPSLARLLALLAAACQQHRPEILTASPTSMKQLEGCWLLAAEENSGDTLVYRPNTYGFPPVRGRTGFTLQEYGRFEQFDAVATGGLRGRDGTWTIARNNHLRIHLTDRQSPDYTLEILSFQKKKRVLRVRRQF